HQGPAVTDAANALGARAFAVRNAAYPALPRDPRVEFDPRAFVHVGPAVDHAFLHEVSKIGEPGLEPFYRFGGIDARALLELDDLGDQLPLAVRDTGLEILFVRSGAADGLGAGHEFSWSLVVAVLRPLRDQRFRCEHERSHRCGVLQRDPDHLRRIDD